MTASDFINWLAAMKAAGLAKTDAECGRLLGVSPDTIVRRKADGCSLEAALACRALFHRLDPWA